ncbi:MULTISPECIES: VOC family protein [Sphingobacterium]|jgi:lactoylglutathione lyase|uniref:VOC family protein n=1 Tax=Sphingobacterium kitahiroshimense TaxID=470446 RepID=A0ABV0BUQ6_9SPHI|nr:MULTISPECIES: VOC family protein [Sphingobacterium]MBB2949962.1 catechol 2,3-dioxygenase-like lactoylglutathione lyase family enzyme [Sphingobacterium sp. JUb56]MCS3554591.1 catechol 2,3-dioxygenase-like lactoylglutathione lyase family enzyme [Sphingobacterium sp. JUb21]MCW2263850.1 catechol 2,3-dioxygenase-like lactoylglutathione lyase family enzyme [Sphingobacterium kitahiroshimense]TCR00154.1 catechol 2,3-dioxygenase-like lactoylglutathione lyase family enzyme [Sphingobacterium sp. JUb78]
MARAIKINHVTLIVDNLEKAAAFYQNELGLEPLAAFRFDYPVMFFKFNDEQQLHLSEWEDTPSFRGHICVQVDDFNKIFFRMKELQLIDITPWGKVRKLPDGAMQLFLRDPAGNLVEISSAPGSEIDPLILEDDLYEEGIYISNRNDFRGYKSDEATLYHK